jgi:plasmid stabilization system protein ParE
VADIVYSPAAETDLEGIGDYIAITLKSPIAALNTVRRIQDSIDKLADFPLMGALLSFIVNVDTDYRYLVCGNYLAFYRTDELVVNIDRILYGKRDYISILGLSLSQMEFDVFEKLTVAEKQIQDGELLQGDEVFSRLREKIMKTV